MVKIRKEGDNMKDFLSYRLPNGKLDWDEIIFDIIVIGVVVLGVVLWKLY